MSNKYEIVIIFINKMHLSINHSNKKSSLFDKNNLFKHSNYHNHNKTSGVFIYTIEN